MAKYLTTDTLIASVQRRAMLPSTQNTFTETDFLAFANEEMDIGITPHILQYHEDYLMQLDLLPVTPSQSYYEIPGRSTGNKVRDISFVDNSNNIFEMTRVTIEDLPYYQNGGFGIQGSGIRAFFIENDEIVLLPVGRHNLVGSLQVSYYLRPNELVATDQIATITAINTVTGELTVDSVPTNLSSLVPMDILQTKGSHKRLAIDVTPTAYTASTITFDPALIQDLTELRVGDYIALAEQCIIPNIPTDLHSMLAQRVACRCLEALGDNAGLAAANAKLAEMEVKTGQLIDNRVEGAPLKVVNRHGFLRQSRRMLRR